MKSDLQPVEQALQIEAERLAEKLAGEFESQGNFFDGVQETVVDFRKRHPYQQD